MWDKSKVNRAGGVPGLHCRDSFGIRVVMQKTSAIPNGVGFTANGQISGQALLLRGSCEGRFVAYLGILLPRKLDDEVAMWIIGKLEQWGKKRRPPPLAAGFAR